VGPVLKSRLVDMGMPTPLPIQKETWTPITKGKNVVIGSATGSGKTLAFLVPLLASTNRKLPCTILILVASKNLAQQIKAVVDGLWPPKDDSVAAHVVDDDPSPNKLPNIGNASVLIGTPKVLRKMMAQAREVLETSDGTDGGAKSNGLAQALRLESNLQKVVVDEADELLNTGYLAEQIQLRKVNNQRKDQRHLMELDQELLAKRRFMGTDAEHVLLGLPKSLNDVQLICASATAGRTLRGQLQGILDAPSIDKATTLVSTGRNVKRNSNRRPQWTPSTLGHSYMLTEPIREEDDSWAMQVSSQLRMAMEHLKPGPAIIFTLPKRIKPLAAALIDSGMNNVRQLKHAHDEELMVREAAQFPGHVLNMKSPKDTPEELSWATAPVFIGGQEDSRGIDLVIDYVFLCSPPASSADYTHVAGRAGRNGRRGLAITLLKPEEAPNLLLFSNQLEISFMPIGQQESEEVERDIVQYKRGQKVKIEILRWEPEGARAKILDDGDEPEGLISGEEITWFEDTNQKDILPGDKFFAWITDLRDDDAKADLTLKADGKATKTPGVAADDAVEVADNSVSEAAQSGGETALDAVGQIAVGRAGEAAATEPAELPREAAGETAEEIPTDTVEETAEPPAKAVGEADAESAMDAAAEGDGEAADETAVESAATGGAAAPAAGEAAAETAGEAVAETAGEAAETVGKAAEETAVDDAMQASDAVAAAAGETAAETAGEIAETAGKAADEAAGNAAMEASNAVAEATSKVADGDAAGKVTKEATAETAGKVVGEIAREEASAAADEESAVKPKPSLLAMLDQVIAEQEPEQEDAAEKEIDSHRAKVVQDMILDALEDSRSRVLPISDKSSPEAIDSCLPGVTKGEFNDALGSLCKAGSVILETAAIHLAGKDGDKEKEIGSRVPAHLQVQVNDASSDRALQARRAQEPKDAEDLHPLQESELKVETREKEVVAKDLQSLTITVLKDKLRSRGLKVTGKKEELITRLEANAVHSRR